MTPLNVNAKDFCKRVGLNYRPELMEKLRELKLVSFFNKGRKYMYRLSDAEKLDQMLHDGEISIKGGNHITINK